MTPKIRVSFHFPDTFAHQGADPPRKGPWRAFNRVVENRRFYEGISAGKPWNPRIFSRRR